MQALSPEEDPNEEHVQTDGTVSMPKRGLIDRIRKVLTIDVTTASNVATVKVLPAVRDHGVLQPTPEQISVASISFATPGALHCTVLAVAWRDQRLFPVRSHPHTLTPL